MLGYTVTIKMYAVDNNNMFCYTWLLITHFRVITIITVAWMTFNSLRVPSDFLKYANLYNTFYLPILYHIHASFMLLYRLVSR